MKTQAAYNVDYYTYGKKQKSHPTYKIRSVQFCSTVSVFFHHIFTLLPIETAQMNYL